MTKIQPVRERHLTLVFMISVVVVAAGREVLETIGKVEWVGLVIRSPRLVNPITVRKEVFLFVVVHDTEAIRLVSLRTYMRKRLLLGTTRHPCTAPPATTRVVVRVVVRHLQGAVL